MVAVPFNTPPQWGACCQHRICLVGCRGSRRRMPAPAGKLGGLRPILVPATTARLAYPYCHSTYYSEIAWRVCRILCRKTGMEENRPVGTLHKAPLQCSFWSVWLLRDHNAIVANVGRFATRNRTGVVIILALIVKLTNRLGIMEGIRVKISM